MRRSGPAMPRDLQRVPELARHARAERGAGGVSRGNARPGAESVQGGRDVGRHQRVVRWALAEDVTCRWLAVQQCRGMARDACQYGAHKIVRTVEAGPDIPCMPEDGRVVSGDLAMQWAPRGRVRRRDAEVSCGAAGRRGVPRDGARRDGDAGVRRGLHRSDHAPVRIQRRVAASREDVPWARRRRVRRRTVEVRGGGRDDGVGRVPPAAERPGDLRPGLPQRA